MVSSRRRQAALTVTDVSKTFTGTKALDQVSFDVPTASVHALLGGNGSGKSTLIKILAGVYSADPNGRIQVGSSVVAVDKMSPGVARDLGLRFVHQNPGLVREMSVAENVALTNGYSTRRGVIAWSELHRRTGHLLDRFAIGAHPQQPLGELRPADQTMVAIARALEDDRDGLSTLVLDEPTASLPSHEVDTLLAAMHACADAGQTIVFVSHRIDEVMAACDSVTVLRDGHHIMTRSAEGLSEETLIEAIVGRSLTSVYQSPPTVETDRVRLQVNDLAGGPIEGVSMTVKPGEIVGVAGLLGSGRSELLRMIYGADRPSRGTVVLDGQPYAPASPSEALRRGVSFVPEDRTSEAAFHAMTVLENLSILNVGHYREPLRYRHDRERNDARTDIESFGIKTASFDAPFESLSGGNQQKVLLARALRRTPRVLLLDEPTQGIDVGARAAIFDLLARFVADGLSVLMVSSDFEELSRITDRVLVLRSGRIIADVPSETLDAASIGELVYSSTTGAAS